MDNCPAHPSGDELVSKDGNVFEMFMSPNTTAYQKKMNQNNMESGKINSHKSLQINYVASYSENLLDSLKSITLNDEVFLANCSIAVKPSLINKSWKN